MGAPLKLPLERMARFHAAVHHTVRLVMAYQISPIAERVAALIGNVALLFALPFGALAFIVQSL